MRILFLTTYYDRYIDMFYSCRPDLALQSYSEQHRALMADGNRWADFLSIQCSKLGYDAVDVVANARPMQEAWEREKGAKRESGSWMLDIVFEQIRQIRPEILFIADWPDEFDSHFVKRCRMIAPSIRIVIGWCGEACCGASYFREHDLILSCSPDTVAELRNQGACSEHLNHAFAPEILKRMGTQAGPPVPVGFIGQLVYGDDYHTKRAYMLKAVEESVGLTFFGNVGQVSMDCYQSNFKGYMKRGYHAGLDALYAAGCGRVAKKFPKYYSYSVMRLRRQHARLFSELREIARPAIFGLDMFRQLSRFNICLNAHGNSSYASNMRLYEATGVGSCLLTDWKANLAELFEPGYEVIAYRSTEECVEQVKYLLEHEEERRSIAAAGQRRTLRDHSFAKRAARLHELITSALRGRLSRASR